MRSQNALFGLVVGLVLVTLWALGSAAAASAATDVVTNLDNSGAGSLRAVAAAAVAGDTVEFESGLTGTITLTGGAIALEKNLTIVGPGASLLKIDAGHKSPIFTTAGAFSSISVSISGLTLAEGASSALGGAIDFDPDVSPGTASLTVMASTFVDNRAGGEGTTTALSGRGAGGAIAFETTGMLTVMNSTFTGNTAGGNGGEGTSSAQGNGGAIEFEGGTLAITDSSFSANRAGGNGGVGESSAQGDGGAIEFEGATLTITDSSFSANRAGGNGGDGISSAQGNGGAVEFEGATLTVAESSFSANSAGGNGGDGTSSAQGNGGALEFSGDTEHATLTVTASTFDGNQAGGSTGGGGSSGEAFGGAVEAFGGGTATLTNDTIEGNTVGGPIGAVSGAGVGGGGLYDTLQATILNDTLDGNAVIGAAGAGGNIDASPGPVTLKNTIVSAGAATTAPNCTANVISAGHNLESTTPSECGLNPALDDLIGANPLLGPLQSNGGPTQTQALLEGSPAIEAGENAGCPATDQRGVGRPQPPGGRCDIGAFESVRSSSEPPTSEQPTSTSSSMSSPAPGGSPSPSGIATTAKGVEELLLGCSKRELVLNDVLIRGGRVELNGSAAKTLDGKKVKIIFDSGKQVATAKVGSHGQFAATAPLPPASIRDSNSARYVAESGRQRSLDLKLNRRLQLENPTFSGGAVSLTGQVLPPLTKPIATVAVEQELECGRTTRVLTFKPGASGRFHVSIKVPATAKAGLYRLTSAVRETTRSTHRFATFSLPLPVVLG